MTIAHKIKSKVSKIFKKYGSDLCVTDGQNKIVAKFGFLSNSKLKHNTKTDNFTYLSGFNIDQLLTTNLQIFKKQIIHSCCIICNDSNKILFYTQHIRRVLQKTELELFYYHTKISYLTNRVIVPICKYHYNFLYLGNYNCIFLRTLFTNFCKKNTKFKGKKSKMIIFKTFLLPENAKV